MRALSLVFLFLIPFTLKAQLQKSLIGKSAPKVVFSSSLQAEIPSNFYKNKLLVLDFWATWCAPCIANFPHFNALASKFEKKGVVFATITDESKQTTAVFFKRTMKHLSGYRLLDVNETTFKSFGVISRPYCVVIDRNNIVRWMGIGSALTENSLSKIINGEPLNQQPATVKTQISALDQKKDSTLLSFNLSLTDSSRISDRYLGNTKHLSGDWISASRTSITLGLLLEQITGFPHSTRILSNDLNKLQNKYDLDFNSQKAPRAFSGFREGILSNSPRRNFLMSVISEALMFKVRRTTSEQEYYKVSIADSVLLNSFKSMKRKKSFSDDNYPRFEIVGHTLQEMVFNLESSTKKIFVVPSQLKGEYDLSLDITTIESIERDLRFHGLGLEKMNDKVEMLEVTFY